jgi:hypothetical protein
MDPERETDRRERDFVTTSATEEVPCRRRMITAAGAAERYASRVPVDGVVHPHQSLSRNRETESTPAALRSDPFLFITHCYSRALLLGAV